MGILEMICSERRPEELCTGLLRKVCTHVSASIDSMARTEQPTVRKRKSVMKSTVTRKHES